MHQHLFYIFKSCPKKDLNHNLKPWIPNHARPGLILTWCPFIRQIPYGDTGGAAKVERIAEVIPNSWASCIGPAPTPPPHTTPPIYRETPGSRTGVGRQSLPIPSAGKLKFVKWHAREALKDRGRNIEWHWAHRVLIYLTIFSSLLIKAAAADVAQRQDFKGCPQAFFDKNFFFFLNQEN